MGEAVLDCKFINVISCKNDFEADKRHSIVVINSL